MDPGIDACVDLFGIGIFEPVLIGEFLDPGRREERYEVIAFQPLQLLKEKNPALLTDRGHDATKEKKKEKKSKKENNDANGKLANKAYVKALSDYQVELVRLQRWIKTEGLRIVVIFEGRDTAGKGARFDESLSL